MILIDGANEAVIRDAKTVCHCMEIRRHFIGKVAHGHVPLSRRLDHLEAMLVGAGLEQHVATGLTLEAGDRVGGDHLIRMADMRTAIGIVDRGGDIERIGHAALLEHHPDQVKPVRADHRRNVATIPAISNTVACASSDSPTAAPASSRAAACASSADRNAGPERVRAASAMNAGARSRNAS